MALVSAGAHHLLPSPSVNAGCKKAYLTGEKAASINIFQEEKLATEHELPLIPESEVVSFCSSPAVYIKPVLTLETGAIVCQAIIFSTFTASLYSSLFQGLDPDPPKNTFC